MTASPPDAETPLERPTLVYDADCGFCVRCVQWLREATGERVEYAASAAAASRFPHVTADDFARAVYLFEPSGRTSRGAEAAVRALAASPSLVARAPLGAYRVVPGVRFVLDKLYATVARRRLAVSRVVSWVAGPDVGPSRWLRSRRVFAFAIGLVSLIAMLSARVQIVGLAGAGGVLPVADTLVSDPDWLHAPTWLWFDASDAALLRLCDVGIAGAALLMLNVLPALGALAVWSVALSLVVAVPGFFSYQWDALLVEATLVAALYAPWHVVARRRTPREPSRLARWLTWFVLFRLMFMSGAVKLASDDAAWANLTALNHHYLTQPLPHVVSWFMDRAPDMLHRVGAAFTFLAELVLPFTIFLPRRLRHAGAVGMITLQVLIFATGNFGWFNLLAIALCLSLFDDQAFTRRRRTEPVAERGRAPVGSCGLEPVDLPPYRERRPTFLPQRVVVIAAALAIVPIGLLDTSEVARDLAGVAVRERQPTREQYDAGLVATTFADGPVDALRLLRFHSRPFRSVNTYGLFAIMTTERPEIRVQLADDDGAWHDVPFRHKPYLARRAPTWSQPHMPRLDWQMWFEALAWQRAGLRFPYQPSAWFVGFLDGLATARPDVHALLAEPPLDGRVPSAIRIRLEYARFTTFDELAETGAWWVFDASKGWITTWER